jgi:hypothetical protein
VALEILTGNFPLLALPVHILTRLRKKKNARPGRCGARDSQQHGRCVLSLLALLVKKCKY